MTQTQVPSSEVPSSEVPSSGVPSSGVPSPTVPGPDALPSAPTAVGGVAGELDSAVLAVVARELRLPDGELSGELRLNPHLDLDGTIRPQLLLAMGEALDAIFPDDFLDGVHTIADLTTAVRVSLGP